MPRMPSPRPFPRSLARLLASALLLAASASHAERADRSKPLTVAADRQGTIDMQKQVVTFSGNVVLTKGTLVIKADRVEVRESSDGFRIATAWGAAGAPATLRQKRDGVDETIYGEAQRLEYEEKAELIKLVDDAVVRRLQGGKVADEITGHLISYSAATEIFNVSARGPAGGGSGRVQAVLAPREGSEAAAVVNAPAAPRPANPPSIDGARR